jgi:predicted GNAT family acetyltransferase
MEAMMPVVRHNPAASQFDIYDNGVVAGYLRYRMEGSEIWFLTTTIMPRYQGKDFETELIRSVLDDAHHRRLGVLPYCPELQTRSRRRAGDVAVTAMAWRFRATSTA